MHCLPLALQGSARRQIYPTDGMHASQTGAEHECNNDLNLYRR
jgi:hypothetical protein